MKSRLLVAAVSIPFLLWVILWAPAPVLTVCLTLLSLIAAWELMKCTGGEREKLLLGIVALGVLLFFCSCALSGSEEYQLRLLGKYLQAAMVIPVLGVFGFGVFKGGEVKTLHLGAALFSMLAIPYAFSAFLRLEELWGGHRAVLLLPLIFSFASDTGAFFAGRAFGRHKLAPKVSPNKTVEGAVGGLVGNIVAALIFAGVMNGAFSGTIRYPSIVLLGALCSVVAQLGDLSFSLIKREFGIKDYGKIFLAHGGVLDRFDSVLFVAPTLAILLPMIRWM